MVTRTTALLLTFLLQSVLGLPEVLQGEYDENGDYCPLGVRFTKEDARNCACNLMTGVIDCEDPEEVEAPPSDPSPVARRRKRRFGFYDELARPNKPHRSGKH